MVVRPVVAGDLPGLDALLSGLDTQARCRRWFSGVIDIHRAALWAAHPAHRSADGLVAVSPAEEIVGHAAYIEIDATRAEVCFEVAARWRRHGVAGRLLEELARRAKVRGVRTLVAEVLSENEDMLAVLRERGTCREHREADVIELEIDVD